MTKSSPKRLLVPDDQIIVVLDTVAARDLAYAESPPSWVQVFAQMAEQGYSFSLADGAVSELLAQRCRDALSAAGCKKIVDSLQRFLNPQLPIMLGKVDLFGMLQINEQPWDADESHALSLTAWERLKRCAIPGDQQPSPEWALQEERDDWIGFLNGWQKIVDDINAEDPDEEPINVESLGPQLLPMIERSQDTWNSLVPPMSVRMHLQNRYRWRQFVRKQMRKGGYDPESPKKRNDGIDADLYHYLLLPALVVTKDKGFFTKLADINSFQKDWFVTPEVLAEAWQRGTRPAPRWP